MEEWKLIKGYDRYEVSSEGNVRSIAYTKENQGRLYNHSSKLIKGVVNKNNGYLQYMIYDNEGKPHLKYAHRLVAEAFLPPPVNGEKYVAHLDKNKLNNNASNLKWKFKSYSKNLEYGIVVPPRSKKEVKLPRYTYIVRQCTITGFVVATFRDFDRLNALGFKKESIITASNGKYRGNSDIYKNYKWKVERIRNVE